MKHKEAYKRSLFVRNPSSAKYYQTIQPIGKWEPNLTLIKRE